MKIYESIKLEMEGEAPRTRKVLERVPMEKATWKPHDKSMALGHLASHVAEIPNWMSKTLKLDVLDLSKEDKPWAASKTSDLVARFDANMKDALKCLDEADEADIMNPWTLNFDGKELVKMPRFYVLRSFVTNHIVHHRAQLGVYLRLLEIPVPSVYGPSADEQV